VAAHEHSLLDPSLQRAVGRLDIAVLVVVWFSDR
jgi:hypothetical protein